MKARNIPCTECRKQRRKCVRLESSKTCTRCERLGRICQQASKASSDTDFDDENITELQDEVERLETVIAQMELQLRHLRVNSNQHHSDISVAHQLTDPMIQHLMSNWKIKIKNGGFQIETGIRSIAELLQVNPNISYLSPIPSTSSLSSFDDSISEAGSCNSFEGAYLGESNLLLRFTEGNMSLSSLTVKLIKKALDGKEAETSRSLLVPSTLLLDSKKLVNEFVDVYFTCHNVNSPLLHEATYRKNLEKSKDPMNDLVTLAICSLVCSNPCEHIVYSSWEGRSMADFFYTKAKSILFEQLEEEDKRFENILGISLLVRYLHITLKIAECRQLIMISQQLCLDLRNDYLDYPPPSHLHCFNYQMHLKYASFTDVFRKEYNYGKGVSKNVNKVIYARNATFAIAVSRLLDFITNTYPTDKCIHVPTWDYIEDEPEMTKKAVKSFNWVLQLFYHPFVEKFMEQVRQIHVGKECTLSFESIIKMEEVLAEWALATPVEFRLCSNLKKPDMCKKAIDEATDPMRIMNFIQYHSWHINIYTCLLQPAPSQTLANPEVLAYVRQHSLEQALNSCHLLLYAVHHLSVTPTLSFCNYLLAAVDFLFDAMDVLALLALSSDQYVAKEAKQMMKSCLKEIDSIKFMQDHRVPKHASPLNNREFPLDGIPDLNYYDQYPQPWYALMYDVSHSASFL